MADKKHGRVRKPPREERRRTERERELALERADEDIDFADLYEGAEI